MRKRVVAKVTTHISENPDDIEIRLQSEREREREREMNLKTYPTLRRPFLPSPFMGRGAG